MKYRIKIKILNSGMAEYCPQIKKRFLWTFLSSWGEIVPSPRQFDNIDEALSAIDKHYKKQIKSVKTRYVEKRELDNNPDAGNNILSNEMMAAILEYVTHVLKKAQGKEIE